jgi:TonB family protein
VEDPRVNPVIAAIVSSSLIFLASPAAAKGGPALAEVAWTAAPGFAEMAAAYPAAAKARGQKGEVILDCAFGDSGRLGRCETISEAPRAAGFAAAALSLSGQFQGPTATADGRVMAGAHVRVAFRFAPDQLDSKAVAHPEWIALPTPAEFQAVFPDAASKAGVLKAKAVMDCTVTATGGLTGCQAVGEEPAGYGFAAATLPLAGGFRLRIWTSEGQPVVGGTVRAPIRYDLKQAAPTKP